MRKLTKSLTVFTIVASLLMSSVGMAEARNHKYNNRQQYCQSYNNNHKNYNQHNNYYRPNKNHRVQHVKYHRAKYIKHQRVQHVKRHHRHNHHNRYLYPALIGAGVGLLVLGLTQ